MKFFKQFDAYYFITLLFILLSSAANFLAANDIIWFVVLLFFSVFALGKQLLKIKDLRIIAVLSIAYLAFVGIRDAVINNLAMEYLISDVVFLFKYVYLAFLYCVIMKDKVAHYFVNVVAHLTVISLFFYTLQLIGLRDYIYAFSESLHLQSAYYIDGYTNFILFTYVRGLHDYRNSGFSWEPGAFGCFLIIALMFNLFLNKFKFDRKSYLFIVAIITTISTTDYLALIVLVFMVYRYKVPRINWGTVMLLLMAGGIFIYIPILGDKIMGTYYEDMDDLRRLKYLEIFYKKNNSQIPLNRFSSMVYLYQTFGWQLILGVSNKYDVIVNSKFNINISNGLFDFMAKFGLVNFILLMYQYARFCLANVKKFEFMIYCVLTLLIIGFGEPIMFLPFVLMFIFLPFEQIRVIKGRVKNFSLDRLGKYGVAR
ncbi:hypothetical protein ACFQZS_11605 [Mucilaginibacter calamicampi]|uniref:Polymerase n=1 Tax=Mucilaginibacter calamicampi TaxID=1302352 RepID=A0ABW2YYX5_9SPHI